MSRSEDEFGDNIWPAGPHTAKQNELRSICREKYMLWPMLRLKNGKTYIDSDQEIFLPEVMPGAAKKYSSALAEEADKTAYRFLKRIADSLQESYNLCTQEQRDICAEFREKTYKRGSSDDTSMQALLEAVDLSHDPFLEEQVEQYYRWVEHYHRAVEIGSTLDRFGSLRTGNTAGYVRQAIGVADDMHKLITYTLASHALMQNEYEVEMKGGFQESKAYRPTPKLDAIAEHKEDVLGAFSHIRDFMQHHLNRLFPDQRRGAEFGR